MRGSWFALFFRVMPALVWDGIEAWWGAQAIATMIGTWSISWAEWDYPIANGTAQLKDFIGCMLSSLLLLLLLCPRCSFFVGETIPTPSAQTNQHITFLVILYHIVFLGVMWLPPEKLHRPFQVSFIGFTFVILGLVIWSTHTAGGAGQYFASDYQAPTVLAGSIG